MVQTTTKVFMSGRSQAVRIPEELRLSTDEVYIERDGDRIILTPKPKSWKPYFDRGRRFGEDFPDHTGSRPPGEREWT